MSVNGNGVHRAQQHLFALVEHIIMDFHEMRHFFLILHHEPVGAPFPEVDTAAAAICAILQNG